MIALYCSAIILAIVCFGLIFINYKVDKIYEFVSDSMKYLDTKIIKNSSKLNDTTSLILCAMDKNETDIYDHFNKRCNLLEEKINILKAQMEDDQR